jgi:hypothetical protein
MYADEEHAACERGVAGAVAARRLTMRERCRWWTCLRVVTSDALRRDNQLWSASKVSFVTRQKHVRASVRICASGHRSARNNRKGCHERS